MGLIPARAGNTVCGSHPEESGEAHPRSRGEHHDGVIMQAKAEGSSPLARGTLYGIVTQEQAAGLIPARAGNT